MPKLAHLEEQLDGFFLYSVASDNIPFVQAYLDDEPSRFPDMLGSTDACWLDAESSTIVGVRDVGKSIPLTVGQDSLALRRAENYFPRVPLLYVYDRLRPAFGATPGANLVLDDLPLTATVPTTLEMSDDAVSLSEVRENGLLSLAWQVDQPRGPHVVFATIEARGDTPSQPAESVRCRFVDDGDAEVDLAAHLPRGRNRYELRVGRAQLEIVEHPALGRLVARVERFRAFVDDLQEPSR